MGYTAYSVFVSENRQRVIDDGFATGTGKSPFSTELSRRWKEVSKNADQTEHDRYKALAKEVNDKKENSGLSEQSAFLRKAIKDQKEDGTATCTICETSYHVVDKDRASSGQMNIGHIKTHLLCGCGNKGTEYLVAGIFLDRGGHGARAGARGSRNKRSAVGDIKDSSVESAMENLSLSLPSAEEFNPIDVAIEALLPVDRIVCICKVVFSKGSHAVRNFGSHLLYECSVLEVMRPSFFDLKGCDTFLMAGVRALSPFSTESLAAKIGKGYSVLYIHYRKLVQILWPDLFVKDSLSYIGIILEIIKDNRDGFLHRKNGHSVAETLIPKNEDIIGIAYASNSLVRFLEALGQCMLKCLNCALKNGCLEILPMVGRSYKDVSEGVRTLKNLLMMFVQVQLSKANPIQLKQAREEYIKRETAKLQGRVV